AEEGLSVSSVLTVRTEKATTNYVPAVAVRRRWRTLSGIIGRKGCVDGRGRTPITAKAVNYSVTDIEARKRGEQKGLDTLVVHALNDDTLARVKLKGIDGDSHKQWSMWFNPIQRVEPYQGLTCPAKLSKGKGGYPDTGAAWPSSVRAV
ncbi:9052_t:CDS:2, partial [Ambispora gerdemannii]